MFIIEIGYCNGLEDDLSTEINDINKYGSGQIISIIVKDIPHFLILSYVTVYLLYRAIKSLKLCTRRNTFLLINENKIDFLCKYDIYYCIDLFKIKSKGHIMKKETFFSKYIYARDSNFRFSSRIFNAHVVALLVMYYFFVDFVSSGVLYLQAYTPSTKASLILQILRILSDIDLFIPKSHTITGFVLTALSSLLICLIQTFLGIRNIKKDLTLNYKGIKTRNRLDKYSNVALATDNSHFTGFLVGFLINGFIFIYMFLFIIYFAIYILIKIGDGELYKEIFLFILPIIVPILFKMIINFIMSKFVFLQERGKYLALDNFRAYSIYLYVTFFYDCLIGTIAALIRFVLGIIGSVFFMPRIGYSFLGNHIERFDTGFKVSNGYIHMELSNKIIF